MSQFGRRLGAASLAAVTPAGCMSGRPSLLATQVARGGAARGLTSLADSSASLGPSRSLASSANASPLTGASVGASVTPAALRISTQVQASANLMAPSPSAGPIQASSRVAAGVGTLAAAGQTSLAITPTLAPASSVGASVAAVSQPLNLAGAAQAGVQTGSTTAVRFAVKLKAAGIGVAVHVGP